jgi:hypothetical protein
LAKEFRKEISAAEMQKGGMPIEHWVTYLREWETYYADTLGPGPPESEDRQRRFLADVLRCRQGLAEQQPPAYYYQPKTLPKFPTEEVFVRDVAELERKKEERRAKYSQLLGCPKCHVFFSYSYYPENVGYNPRTMRKSSKKALNPINVTKTRGFLTKKTYNPNFHIQITVDVE